MNFNEFDKSKLVWDNGICNSLYRLAPGQKIGKLTIITLIGIIRGTMANGYKNRIYYECICDCGNKTITEEDSLKRVLKGDRSSISCGCARAEPVVKWNKSPDKIIFYKNKHGKNDSAMKTYRSIVKRIKDNHHPKYHRYGGRGITICPEWDFKSEDKRYTKEEIQNQKNTGADNFCDWMYNVAGYTPDMGAEVSIDRIDPDGPYSPDNCHLALNKGQSNNKPSQNVYYNWYEQKYTQTELSWQFGKNSDRVGEKVKEGKSIYEALLAPNFRSRYERQHALESSPNGMIVTPKAFAIEPFRFVDHCEIDPRNHWRPNDVPGLEFCPNQKAYEHTLDLLATKIRKFERDNDRPIKPFEFVENATTDFLAYSFVPSLNNPFI